MESISNWEALFRLVVAAILGGVIGYDREMHNKPAGIRTYMLVAMGAALFMIASIVIIERLGQPEVSELRVSVDASRIAAGVIAGVGFIGGGMILRTRERVTGLTTAAGIWVTAGVGVLVGLGEIEIPIIATLLALATLTLGWIRWLHAPARESPDGEK
jgi:putative Mg2+ transporter-C (MgtC) family protein